MAVCCHQHTARLAAWRRAPSAQPAAPLSNLWARATRTTSSSNSSSRRRRRKRAALQCSCKYSFILYTKPECPLCDGLKDKVQALIDRAEFVPSFLSGATLEVRDISTNEAWQDAMHLSVPVLAVLDSQQQEAVLPRPPPRVPADRLQRHLQEALQAAGLGSSSSDGSDGGSSSDSSSAGFTVIS